MNLKSAKRSADTPLKRTVSTERLQKLLLKKPPLVESVSKFETYSLNDDGTRIRRICGQRIGLSNNGLALPDFVPASLDNPWQVTNPRKQYVCPRVAGWKTNHVGVGFCKRHDRGKDRTIVKNPLQGVEKKTSSKAFSDDNENLLIQIGDFDTYLVEAQAATAPDQLLDLTRPLYQIEALKLMTIEWMRQFGFNSEAIESIARRIQESANVQLTLAKRDHEIIRNKAVAAMVRVFVTGFLSILQSELSEDPAKAKEIARRFNEELLLPVQNIGLTEILKRQEADGDYNKVVELAEFSEDDEETPL